MRPALLLAALFIIGSPGAAYYVADEAGDVESTFNGGPRPAGLDGEPERVDIIAFWMIENRPRDAWTIGIQVAEPRVDQDAEAEPAIFSARFSIDGKEFVARAKLEPSGVDAGLHERTSGGGLTPRLRDLSSDFVPSNGTLLMHVPRALIAELMDRDVENVRPLSDIWVTVSSSISVGDFGVANVSMTNLDRAPNEDSGSMDVHFGARSSDALSPTSVAGLRASNGEATILVIPVDWEVLESGTYPIQVGEPPSGWRVTSPFSEVIGTAGDVVTLPVVLDVPFHHSHGTQQTVTLTAGGAEYEVGIQYVEPPQPTGHHNRLWLNAAVAPPGFGQVTDSITPFLSTLEFEETAWVPFLGPNNPTGPEELRIAAPLAPQLSVPLEFRSGDATLTLEARSTIPVAGEIVGELFVMGAEDPRLVALFPPVAASLPGQDTPVSVELASQLESSIVKFHPNHELELRLTWRGEVPLNPGALGGPQILTPATFELPLKDPKDIVDGFGNGRLALESGVKVLAAPGSAVLTPFKVLNRGDEPLEVRLTAHGDVEPKNHVVAVPASGEATVEFLVQVGSEAASIAVIATSVYGEWAATFIEAEPSGIEEKVVDELAAPRRDSPGLGVAAIVVVAGAALARRGSRQ